MHPSTETNTSQLSVNLEMLLVQHLKDRVEETTQRRALGLLNDLRPSFPRIMLRDQRGQLVHVHDELGALLVGASEDELQLLCGNAHGLEDRPDDFLVVLRAALDQLEGSLEGVQEAVDVCEKDHDLALCGEQLGDLQGGQVVARMGTGRCCCACIDGRKNILARVSPPESANGRVTPVDSRVAPFEQDILNDFGVEELGEVVAYKVESRFRGGIHC